MEENNNFLYKGYLLVIDVSGDYLSARCRELKYDNVAFQMSTLKNDFMTFVDEKLEEKDMKILETVNYLGWDLDIYQEDNGVFIGIKSDLHFRTTNIYRSEVLRLFREFVDKGRQNQMTEDTNKTPKGMFVYKGYLLEIILDPTLKLYKGVCKELNLTMVEEVVENLQDRFISYINSWRLVDKSTEDKAKKIAELVKVIDGLNKKLEEKDKKIERLKSKIAAVKFEINKAE